MVIPCGYMSLKGSLTFRYICRHTILSDSDGGSVEFHNRSSVRIG